MTTETVNLDAASQLVQWNMKWIDGLNDSQRNICVELHEAIISLHPRDDAERAVHAELVRQFDKVYDIETAGLSQLHRYTRAIESAVAHNDVKGASRNVTAMLTEARRLKFDIPVQIRQEFADIVSRFGDLEGRTVRQWFNETYDYFDQQVGQFKYDVNTTIGGYDVRLEQQRQWMADQVASIHREIDAMNQQPGQSPKATAEAKKRLHESHFWKKAMSILVKIYNRSVSYTRTMLSDMGRPTAPIPLQDSQTVVRPRPSRSPGRDSTATSTRGADNRARS